MRRHQDVKLCCGMRSYYVSLSCFLYASSCHNITSLQQRVQLEQRAVEIIAMWLRCGNHLATIEVCHVGFKEESYPPALRYIRYIRTAQIVLRGRGYEAVAAPAAVPPHKAV